MSHPVTVLRTVEKVDRIVSILRYEAHDGFPVVDDLDIHRRVRHCSLSHLVNV